MRTATDLNAAKNLVTMVNMWRDLLTVQYVLDIRFQQYISVESRWSLVKLMAEIPFDVGCLAPCSALTAFHALEEIKDAIKYAINGKGGCMIDQTDQIILCIVCTINS